MNLEERNTAKQLAVKAALAAHTVKQGESRRQYWKRIAAVAGVSDTYVKYLVDIERCARIGAEVRAREAETAKSRVQVMPAWGNVGPVRNFHGWIDTFGRFKAIGEAYLALARGRGDVFAAAFLQDIIEVSERAQRRASLSTAN